MLVRAFQGHELRYVDHSLIVAVDLMILAFAYFEVHEKLAPRRAASAVKTTPNVARNLRIIGKPFEDIGGYLEKHRD